MAKQEKNVVGLAKGKTTTPRAKKPTPSKPKTDNKTPTEKAKEKVTELLSDVSLPPKKEELLEFGEETPTDNKEVEWLKEQVHGLTETNQKLSKENQELRTKSASSVEAGVVKLFNEFQREYNKHSAQTRRYTTIYLNALMSKMLETFPFLKPPNKG